MMMNVVGWMLTLTLWMGETPPVSSMNPSPKLETAGTPVRIELDIPSIELKGPRAFQQLLVTGYYDDKSLRDLTRLAKYSSGNESIARVSASGQVNAVADGSAEIVVEVAGMQAKAMVGVRGVDTPSPISFNNEIVPALTRAGCNSGACHGTPSGKNGFRLSLQGYLPDQDHIVLTRELFGRRINRIEPEQSLVLLKGSARVPHEGGRRFGPDQESYQVMLRWIAEGSQASPKEEPSVVRLEISPRVRVLKGDSFKQQIVVRAHYADGSSRDVTPLVAFSTSDPAVADVSKSGVASFIEKGSVAILCRYLHLVDNAKLTHLKDVPGYVWPDLQPGNFVDEHVFAKLQELQIPASSVCTDAEFIRRVSLDIAGVLPTPNEVQAFLADADPQKRAKLIDRTLDRAEFADFWAMKWADVLRSTRKLVTYRGSHNYRRFLVQQFAENRPFDEFARMLLTASGDPAIDPAANYYRVARDPLECAESTAQLFLGVRMQCAKCHNHPFERWTQDDYYGLAACFARVGRKANKTDAEREVVFVAKSGEVNHLRTGAVMTARAPGSPPFPVSEDPNDDRRAHFAQWLTSKENPFFAKSVVNRIWFHLMGKGIVEPVDDFRDSNPPRIESLLDALAKDFSDHGYDFKHIVRVIVNSKIYQLSARVNDLNKSDEKYFSHAYTRILPAEVLLDALSTATGVPEKFPGLPLGTRAVQLPDGEIGNEFLQAFGQPTRELVCECARETETTLTQALNLINGNAVHAKLRSPDNRVHQSLAANATDDVIIENLYLSTLSRPPVEEEKAAATAHIAKIGDRARALEDLHWALINCKEFMFRH